MSSPSQPGASAPKDDKSKKSLTGFLRRAKTALKREGSLSTGKRLVSKITRQSTVSDKPEPVVKSSEPTAPETKPVGARAKYEGMAGVSKLSRNQMIEERAKMLGERYGLDFNISDIQQNVSLDETVLRIDKPIRMRIRRTCHRCGSSFALAKECPNCQHTRCAQCTRYPPRRTEAEITASRERRAALIKANKENAPIIPDYEYIYAKRKEIVITRPSKTGGQDLVYKKPRQRVRRTCHKCSELFTSGTKTCDKCGHVRCTDCPRDPPKKDKYPFGYPGDEFGPNSIPYYECKTCKTLFPVNAEDGTKCKKCGLEKTDLSPRALPRKVNPEPDLELLKQLQKRLETLKVA